jgi:hypothetical protein
MAGKAGSQARNCRFGKFPGSFWKDSFRRCYIAMGYRDRNMRQNQLSWKFHEIQILHIDLIDLGCVKKNGTFNLAILKLTW